MKHANKEELQEQERLRKEYEKLNIEHNNVECYSSKHWLKLQGLRGKIYFFFGGETILNSAKKV